MSLTRQAVDVLCLQFSCLVNDNRDTAGRRLVAQAYVQFTELTLTNITEQVSTVFMFIHSDDDKRNIKIIKQYI